jgi:hypothetical protein
MPLRRGQIVIRRLELYSNQIAKVTIWKLQALDILSNRSPSGTERKTMKEAPSLLQLIPDIFFDALAYILPSSLLFIGVMIIPSSIGSPLVKAYLNLGASFDRFIVVLFGIGILYIIGQLLTHFSYDLILLPLRKLAAWRKDKEFVKTDIEWMADYTFIRHKDAALGLEISKRYARTIMSRNNALVGLLLMLTSLLSGQRIGLTISGILFLLFLHEAYGEQRFFSRYLQEMTRELRNLEPAPKSE